MGFHSVLGDGWGSKRSSQFVTGCPGVACPKVFFIKGSWDFQPLKNNTVRFMEKIHVFMKLKFLGQITSC